MSEIQQLLGQMPIQQIAQQVGVDEAMARQAVEAVLPALVGGMQANASDPAGAASLLGALGGHQGELDARLAGDVDVADGQKIVQNIFGGNTDRIAQAAAGGGGSALGDIIRKVLPIVAPIVIAWVANKYFGGAGQGDSGQGGSATQQAPTGDNPFSQGSPGSDSPLQVPGGQVPAGQAQQGGGLGDLLGGILGGGSQGQQGPLGPLGDILGGLLGGGRR